MAFTRFTQSSLTTGVGKYIDADAGRTPIPSVPTIGTATDGGTGTTVSVAFTPGYYPGNYYTVLSNPGSITATGNSSPITVSGLTTGTSYNFSVSATNNTGTSAYSAASNSVTPAVPPSFESIATATGTGSSGTITFSSIPGTYKALQIRGVCRDTSTGSGTLESLGFNLRFNGDSGSNYTEHYLRVLGTTVSATGQGTGASRIEITGAGTNSGGSNTATMGVSILDIIDYASTSKNKTLRAFVGADMNNTVGTVVLKSGLWISASAITSITLLAGGSNFSTNTTFALYGIKG